MGSTVHGQVDEVLASQTGCKTIPCSAKGNDVPFFGLLLEPSSYCRLTRVDVVQTEFSDDMLSLGMKGGSKLIYGGNKQTQVLGIWIMPLRRMGLVLSSCL